MKRLIVIAGLVSLAGCFWQSPDYRAPIAIHNVESEQNVTLNMRDGELIAGKSRLSGWVDAKPSCDPCEVKVDRRAAIDGPTIDVLLINAEGQRWRLFNTYKAQFQWLDLPFKVLQNEQIQMGEHTLALGDDAKVGDCVVKVRWLETFNQPAASDKPQQQVQLLAVCSP